MIRSGLILMIKDLAAKGKSAYAIGQEIGISKNTARKYMTQSAQPHGLKGIKRGSKLDPYKELLDAARRLQLCGADGAAACAGIRRRDEHPEGICPSLPPSEIGACGTTL